MNGGDEAMLNQEYKGSTAGTPGRGGGGGGNTIPMPTVTELLNGIREKVIDIKNSLMISEPATLKEPVMDNVAEELKKSLNDISVDLTSIRAIVKQL